MLAETGLKKRWQGQEDRISSIIDDLQAGRDWTRNLVAKGEVWEDLPGLEGCPVERLAADYSKRDLRGLELRDVDLSGTGGLADSCLDFCEFKGVSLRGSNLRGTRMRRAKVSQASVLDGANLDHCDFSLCIFSESSLQGATFHNTDIRGTAFQECDLREVQFHRVRFSKGKLLGCIFGAVQGTRFVSEDQDPSDWERRSDATLKRFAGLEIAKRRLSRTHPVLGGMDYLLTNYGRSPGRLLGWVIFVWLLFAVLFSAPPLPKILANTIAETTFLSMRPMFVRPCQEDSVDLSLPDALFLSAITLTNFGHSTIVPIEDSWSAKMYVLLEILTGYVLLGAFISLFTHILWIRDVV